MRFDSTFNGSKRDITLPQESKNKRQANPPVREVSRARMRATLGLNFVTCKTSHFGQVLLFIYLQTKKSIC